MFVISPLLEVVGLCWSSHNYIFDPVKRKPEIMCKPSNAFVAASWAALGIGFIGFIVGLWNAEMVLHEKGYYFTVIMFGLFSVISVQKAVRDRLEGIPVTDLYYGISWFSTLLCIALLVVGLWNAELWPSEKGFYAFAFILALFGTVAVQKNTRDRLTAEALEEQQTVRIESSTHPEGDDHRAV